MLRLIGFLTIILLLISCKSDLPTRHLGSLETEVVGGGRIWSLDWSPDGQYIAVGNATGLLRIYNAENLELSGILTGFTSTINGINWSPDGKKIVASGAYDDTRVIIWDLVNKTQIIMEDHTGQVRSVQWSPKGSHFASTSHDGTIKVWTPEGKFIKEFSGANFGCVGIDWLDEDTLAASCWDNTIRTYSMSSKEGLVIENGNHRGKAVLGISWHPEGELLVSGDYGNSQDSLHVLKFWTNKGILKSSNDSHKKEIRDLAWNRSGELLATGGETVRLWNKDGDLLKVFDSNTSPIWSLDWNPEGTQIATGHNDGKIRIWNTDGVEVKLLDGHSTEIHSYSYSKDSTFLVIGFSNGELRFIDTKSLTSQTFKVHTRGINSVAWTRRQHRFAVSSNDGTASLWEIRNKKLIHMGITSKNNGFVHTISWSPDETKVATGSNNYNITVWDINGSFKYSVPTDVQHVYGIKWENDMPVLKKSEKVEMDNPIEVFLKINKNKLAFIPLNKNRFALIDSLGNLFRGDKKDFIRMIDDGSGFTKLMR